MWGGGEGGGLSSGKTNAAYSNIRTYGESRLQVFCCDIVGTEGVYLVCCCFVVEEKEEDKTPCSIYKDDHMTSQGIHKCREIN